MKFFRIAFIKKIILLTVCFHIINSSIDAPDVLPEWAPEDLSYNEIESVTEWLVEVVFANNNFLQEHDDQDDNKKKIQLKKKKNYHCSTAFSSNSFYELNINTNNNCVKKLSLSFKGNIHSPPPEIIA